MELRTATITVTKDTAYLALSLIPTGAVLLGGRGKLLFLPCLRTAVVAVDTTAR